MCTQLLIESYFNSIILFLACKMSENMFLLLQSLVTICQSLDTSGLIDLESEFWPLLSKQQKELLRILVKSYC